MPLSEHLQAEYERLSGLGEYSDAAAVMLHLTGHMADLARRLEALEAKLGPLAEMMRIANDARLLEAEPPKLG